MCCAKWYVSWVHIHLANGQRLEKYSEHGRKTWAPQAAMSTHLEAGMRQVAALDQERLPRIYRL